MVIEYAMYFALGFLIAGLLMLMAMPAFWRRAMRLSMRRLQLLAPLSREDAIAERDLLRAEFALKERALEQRLEAAGAEKATIMLDIGRHALRISDLHEQLQASIANGHELERTLAHTRGVLEERTELLGATESALREAHESAQRDAARQVEINAEHEAKLGDLHHLNTALRREFAELGEAFARVSTQAERLAGADETLTRIAAEFDSAKTAKAALDKDHAALRKTTDAERERLIGEITHLENALRQTRAEARANADRLEALSADHAQLQGAAAALRTEQEERSRLLDECAAAPESADFAALRREIAALGARLGDGAAEPERLRDTASA